MVRNEQPKSINGWQILIEDEIAGHKFIRALVPVRHLWEHRSDYNPRKPVARGDKLYSDLTGSLTDYGLVEDPVYNLTTHNLVGGEQRVRVIFDSDHDALVPTILMECDAEQEVRFCIALNRIHNEFDDTKLADVFRMLKADQDFAALKTTGFDRDDAGAIMRRFLEDPPAPETPARNVICPHCGHTGPPKEFETADTEPRPGMEQEAKA